MGLQINIVQNDIPVIIKKVAAETQSKVIDMSGLFYTSEKSDPYLWSSDGVHPNNYGYSQIAAFVYKRLT